MTQSYEDYLAQNPLYIFSNFTGAQVNHLCDIAAEIRDNLDRGMHERGIDYPTFNRFYVLFWLWVLGAFEVVRTMNEGRVCFSEPVQVELKRLKKRLATIRSPFAKQKNVDPHIQFRAESSISGTDPARKDYCFTIGGQQIWARSLIDEFERVLRGIRSEDVLSQYRRR
jgi:hypothetical protein